jgi:DNA-binding transcriptional ArsR family regulator
MANPLNSDDRLLWWWFVGTRGGPTRARIVIALKEEPLNAKQLADFLDINYKTVRHHLKVLSDHHLLESFGDKYGKAYSLSPVLEANYEAFVQVQKTGLSRRVVRIIG